MRAIQERLDFLWIFQSHVPERMFSYHAGPITGLDTSPVAHFVATTGVDRKWIVTLFNCRSCYVVPNPGYQNM